MNSELLATQRPRRRTASAIRRVLRRANGSVTQPRLHYRRINRRPLIETPALSIRGNRYPMALQKQSVEHVVQQLFGEQCRRLATGAGIEASS